MAMVINLTLKDFSYGDVGIVFTGGSARVSNDGGSNWTTYNDTLILDAPGEWVVEELTMPTKLQFDDGNGYVTHIIISGVSSSINCEQMCIALFSLVYFEGDMDISSLAAAFAYCSSLVQINGKMTSTNFYGCFYQCTSLLCIGGINSSGATNTDLMFTGVNALSPNTNTRSMIVSGMDWEPLCQCMATAEVFEYQREVPSAVLNNFTYANRDIAGFQTSSFTYANRLVSAPILGEFDHANRLVSAPTLEQLENSRSVWARMIELYNIKREISSPYLNIKRYAIVRHVDADKSTIMIKRVNI
ncbi:MAG: hypothetical protein WCR98_06750 [Saccharofermentanales bacterium]